jgi:hypothetical protein
MFRNDHCYHGDVAVRGLPGAPLRRRFPPGLVAFVLATIVGAMFALHGYAGMRAGGCDGGTCLIAFVMGLVHGGIAWMVVFPVAWVLLARLRRMDERREPRLPPS